MTVAQPLTFTMPLRTVNELNVREHHMARARRARRERESAVLHMWHLRHAWPSLPVTVALTRLGPKTLDDDGLRAALKHVRDGIADAYGCDDSDKAPITWAYAQEKSRDYGVRITIATADVAPAELFAGGHR